MGKLALTLGLATLSLVACDNDTNGTVTEVRAGDGLSGGGAGPVVDVAVDFNQVAAKTHTHKFSDITGVPTAATTGASCPAGSKAIGVDVSLGTVSCAPDSDTLAELDCPEGDVAEFTGGAWACGPPSSGGGTVTSITAGVGLLGGTITTSGRIDVDFAQVATSTHTHPELASPWIMSTPETLEFDGRVGIGRFPFVALEVEGVDGQLVLHDRAGGNSAAVILEDTDNSGGTLNLNFQRGTGSAITTNATVFLAVDNSLAYQTDGTAHRFKVSAGVEAMRIQPTGFVGIGTPAPTHLLEVSNGVTSAFCDGTNWVNASSRAVKEGIRAFAADDYQRVRRWLDETNVVWYRYRGDKDPRTRVGLIAEDVPEVLATADRKGISTADAVGFLTAATKELAAENERLKLENHALSGRLSDLEQRLAKLEHGR